MNIKHAGRHGYSPVFEDFKELDGSSKEEIFKVMCNEAKDLLHKGIKYYDEIRKKMNHKSRSYGSIANLVINNPNKI